MASHCVGSGMCCKIAPCPYGTWNEEKHQCEHLEIKEVVDGTEIHQCGIYEEILKQPGSDISPAFGAGCCSSMFNTNRQKIIQLVIGGRISLPHDDT